MRAGFRAIWLPALAVLLPCVFIGALAVKWLTVEREAAARRTEEAARAVVSQLQRQLVDHLASLAPDVMGQFGAEWPPLRARTFPSPVAAAYLFDPAGRLIAPARQVEAPSNDPSAAAALQIVSAGAQALNSGELERVHALAGRVFREYPATRDEFGVAFASYAAWQRATALDRSGRLTSAVDLLVREFSQLIATGHIGTSIDITQLDLLGERLGNPAGWPAVMDAVRGTARRLEAEQEQQKHVSTWSAANLAEVSEVTLGVLRRDGQTLIALLPVPEGRLAVVVEPAGFGRWIQDRSPQGYDVTLGRDDGRQPGAFVVPFISDAASPLLHVMPTEADSLSEERERLFMAAVAGALALTILVGYLALRDISRELSVASARASFIAGVTHELKTPLTSIRLMAETLRHDRARSDERLALLDTIVNETAQLGEVMDNVLSSARIESGTRAYDPAPARLAVLVRDGMARFDYVLRKEGFSADLRIDDDSVVTVVDAAAFGQALLNLLSNALKYSGRSTRIEVHLRHEADTAILEVRDFGVGIPEREQRRVFERFYRVASTAQHVAGAGLGLALVRHFAEAHGGRITLSSIEGQGSVFRLHLPLVQPSTAGAREVPAHG